MFEEFIKLLGKRNKNFRYYEVELYLAGYRHGKEDGKKLAENMPVITGIPNIDERLRQVKLGLTLHNEGLG